MGFARQACRRAGGLPACRSARTDDTAVRILATTRSRRPSRPGCGCQSRQRWLALKPRAFTLDVVGCGGLTRAVELLEQACVAGIPIFPHGRSLIPAVHLAAAYPHAVTAAEYQLQWEPTRQLLYAEPWQPMRG